MPETRRRHLREVALLFTRLGFTAFGGPAAHVALIEDEVVRRRKWLDREHFLDLVGIINFIPGPNSTELAIHLGYLRAGWAGLITAGACFIAPAALIVLPLAWIYVTYGQLPQASGLLTGINACVIAIIAAALWRFARTAVKDRFTAVVSVAAAVAGFLTRNLAPYQPELMVLAVSAAAGAIYYARPRPLPTLALAIVLDEMLLRNLTRMTLLFLKIGATLFGSGYLLVSYLRSGVVEQYGWFTETELLTAITVGQVTPGPILTTATFVGYVLGHKQFGGGIVGGIAGGLLATIAIFLPSFLFVAILARLMDRLRQNRSARGALDGLNAAVVALIFVVAIELARSSLRDPLSIIIAGASLIALLRWNVNATWLILTAAGVGAAQNLISS